MADFQWLRILLLVAKVANKHGKKFQGRRFEPVRGHSETLGISMIPRVFIHEIVAVSPYVAMNADAMH
mgnify:CR=1 FL=1